MQRNSKLLNQVLQCPNFFIDDPTDQKSCCFNLETLRFTFFCDIKTREEHYIYGTGGEILGSLKRVIGHMNTLRRLELIDLLLDSEEALGLLDDACMTLCERLNHLTIINPSKYPIELLHPAAFINLKKLFMSPQNVGDELISVLCANPQFEELHIVQNSYTDIEPGIKMIMPQVSPKIWIMAQFKVYLRTWFKNIHRELMFQEKAPVTSIIYDGPISKPCADTMLTITDMYPGLTEFGYFAIPKFRSSRRFLNRIDIPLVRFCRRLPYLTTLVWHDVLKN